MLRFIIEIILCTFCLYGVLSFFKDIFNTSTYNKISNRVKLILTVRNVEDGIENYIRELNLGKNFYNNLVVIDLDSEDRTIEILEELQKDCMNIKILSKQEGEVYLNNAIK